MIYCLVLLLSSFTFANTQEYKCQLKRKNLLASSSETMLYLSSNELKVQLEYTDGTKSESVLLADDCTYKKEKKNTLVTCKFIKDTSLSVLGRTSLDKMALSLTSVMFEQGAREFNFKIKKNLRAKV